MFQVVSIINTVVPINTSMNTLFIKTSLLYSIRIHVVNKAYSFLTVLNRCTIGAENYCTSMYKYYHHDIKPRPKSFIAPVICITAGISSSGASPILDERRRSAGVGMLAPPLLLLPAALSCDSDVVVAVVPLTDFVSAVNVIVRTLNRTCSDKQAFRQSVTSGN